MGRVQNHDDAEAFAQIVHRWEGPIRNLCVRMTADLHRAEDLTQETFARAQAQLGRLGEGDRFKPWVLGIARNVALEARRVRRHEAFEEEDEALPAAVLQLRQGFGRLIRSRTDRGVLALLDNRITRQRYGQIFFDSLPDYAFTTELADVEAFFYRP